MDRGASSGQRVTMRNAACKAILQQLVVQNVHHLVKKIAQLLNFNVYLFSEGNRKSQKELTLIATMGGPPEHSFTSNFLAVEDNLMKHHDFVQ
jgi:hypothetical protein